MWTWRQLSHCSDSAVTDHLSSSKISASYLKFYAFNYCLLGSWVGNLSSFKIFVIAWSWSRHPCNKSCISCQNNWWNESNLKFNVLSSIMLCCKYSWLYYTDSELKPIHHILHLEHLRGISFLMSSRGLMNWLHNRLRCARCIFILKCLIRLLLKLFRKILFN